MQRALHACSLLLPAAGERRAPRQPGRGLEACGWGAVSWCVSGASARVGGGLESPSGRAEPARAGRAVSLCALLARHSRVPACARCASPRPAPRLGLHASGPQCASGLLFGGALWDWGWLGLGVCPGLVCRSVEVPAVFSSRSLVCVGLPCSRSLPLVSAPVSVSHKVSAPVCVSLRVSLWYVSRSMTSSGLCSSVCVGILDPRIVQSFVLFLPPFTHLTGQAWEWRATSLERVTRSCRVTGPI